MIAVGSNFFYTVALPVTLWFLDKGKPDTERADTVLFLNARNMFRQLDRTHRDFLPQQMEYLANIVRLYRGERVETIDGSDQLLEKSFPDGVYTDVPGLCSVATTADIKARNFDLSPGRYTGTAVMESDGEDFSNKLAKYYDEFLRLKDESEQLAGRVDHAIQTLLTQ